MCGRGHFERDPFHGVKHHLFYSLSGGIFWNSTKWRSEQGALGVQRQEPGQPAGGFQEEGVPSVQAGHEEKVLSRPEEPGRGNPD